MSERNRRELTASTVKALARLGVVEFALELHRLAEYEPKPGGRTNADRAGKAGATLAAYAALDGDDLSASPALVEEMVIDLLADLLHYAQRHNVDFDKFLWLARTHHRSEAYGSEPDGL